MASNICRMNLSDIASKLDFNEQSRYIDKIVLVGKDPYLVPDSDITHSIDKLPESNSVDIMAYLISAPSPCTAKSFQA